MTLRAKLRCCPPSIWSRWFSSVGRGVFEAASLTRRRSISAAQAAHSGPGSRTALVIVHLKEDHTIELPTICKLSLPMGDVCLVPRLTPQAGSMAPARRGASSGDHFQGPNCQEAGLSPDPPKLRLIESIDGQTGVPATGGTAVTFRVAPGPLSSGRGCRQKEPRVGHQAVVVEGHIEPVKGMRRSHQSGATLLGLMGSHKRHLPSLRGT